MTGVHGFNRLTSRLGGLMLLLALLPARSLAQDTVQSWEANITIRSDAVLDIVERIRVRAESDALRVGLKRPFAIEETPDLVIALVDMQRDGVPVAARLDKDGTSRTLLLGDSAAPQLPGDHLYVLHYTVLGAVRFEEDSDRLIWQVTPKNFELPIEDAQAHLFLPGGLKVSRQSIRIATKGVRANDFITQSRDGQMSIDVMRPLKADESLVADVRWAKGVVQRPSPAQLAQKRLRGQLHVVAGVLGFMAVIAVSWLLRLLAARSAKRSSGDALGPAMSRLVRLGRVDDTSVVATIIGMATKGYLTIERTESDTYLLQRTWKEGDLGLISTDRSIATALYKDKPSRFFVLRENMESLREAQFLLRHSLQREIESVLLRIALPWLLTMILAALLAIGVIIHFAPVSLEAWIPALLILAGQIMAYRALCLRPSALRWQIGREQRGMLTTLGDALTTRTCLPGLAVMAAGFVWLVVLLKLPSAILILLIAGMAVLTTHRMRSIQRLGGKLLAAVSDSEDLMLDNDSAIDPPRFERDLPLAVALEIESTWSQPFAAVLHENGPHSGYRPRWYSGLRGSFAADQFAPDLAQGLRAAIESAIG